MENKDIGERIKARREYLDRRRGGYAQEDIARQLGITRAGYSHWEQGRRAVNVIDLARLAKILDCSVTDFLEEPDDPRRIPTDAEDEAIVLKYYRGIPIPMRPQAKKILRAFMEDDDYEDGRVFGKKVE